MPKCSTSLQDHYRKIYPVVSIPTGAASSDKHVLANRDWIRQFDEVVLMVDQDEVGQMGAEKLAKIIGQDKVKISNYPEKDLTNFMLNKALRLLWTLSGMLLVESCRSYCFIRDLGCI